MGPANTYSAKLFICVATAAIGAVAVAGWLGSAPRSEAPVQAMLATATFKEDLPHADLHLASQQAAFAMSHLGAMRDDADIEPREPARTASDAKPRAAAPKPATAPRVAAPVMTPPLPPVLAPQPAAQTAAPERKPATLFGVALPSPGKLVDRVASLGESLTSLVRWR